MKKRKMLDIAEKYYLKDELIQVGMNIGGGIKFKGTLAEVGEDCIVLANEDKPLIIVAANLITTISQYMPEVEVLGAAERRSRVRGGEA